MSSHFENIAVVVLAAGKGTRIGSHLPKVLYPIAGKPMISYVLKTITQLPIADIFVVTGYRAEDVKASVGRQAHLVYQAEQLGTGHAVHCSLNELPADIHTILVLNGDDSAFYQVKTLRNFIQSHLNTHAVMSVLTAQVQNPTGLGRIIRDQNDRVVAIREEKDATDHEKAITEVNVGCYAFSVDWISQTVDKLTLSSAGEYYIVEALKIAVAEQAIINVQKLARAYEWRGVNTQAELASAHHTMVDRLAAKNQPTAFFIDLDNTLLATEQLKHELLLRLEQLALDMAITNLTAEKLTETYQQTYQEIKQAEGWISIPDLAVAIADKLGLPKLTNPIKRVAYTLPFDRFLAVDATETLKFLGSYGKRVVFADGDLVYSPIKINRLGLDSLVDDVLVYETKQPNIAEVFRLYDGYRPIVIDDQIQVLESCVAANPKTITIWINQGPYSQQKPSDGQFKPTHSIATFAELETVIRDLY